MAHPLLNQRLLDILGMGDMIPIVDDEAAAQDPQDLIYQQGVLDGQMMAGEPGGTSITIEEPEEKPSKKKKRKPKNVALNINQVDPNNLPIPTSASPNYNNFVQGLLGLVPQMPGQIPQDTNVSVGGTTADPATLANNLYLQNMYETYGIPQMQTYQQSAADRAAFFEDRNRQRAGMNAAILGGPGASPAGAAFAAGMPGQQIWGQDPAGRMGSYYTVPTTPPELIKPEYIDPKLQTVPAMQFRTQVSKRTPFTGGGRGPQPSKEGGLTHPVYNEASGTMDFKHGNAWNAPLMSASGERYASNASFKNVSSNALGRYIRGGLDKLKNQTGWQDPETGKIDKNLTINKVLRKLYKNEIIRRMQDPNLANDTRQWFLENEKGDIGIYAHRVIARPQAVDPNTGMGTGTYEYVFLPEMDNPTTILQDVFQSYFNNNPQSARKLVNMVTPTDDKNRPIKKQRDFDKIINYYAYELARHYTKAMIWTQQVPGQGEFEALSNPELLRKTKRQK